MVVDLVNTLVLNLGTSCVITCFLQLEKSWNGVKVKGLVLQGRLLETFQIAELLGLSCSKSHLLDCLEKKSFEDLVQHDIYVANLQIFLGSLRT